MKRGTSGGVLEGFSGAKPKLGFILKTRKAKTISGRQTKINFKCSKSQEALFSSIRKLCPEIGRGAPLKPTLFAIYIYVCVYI